MKLLVCGEGASELGGDEDGVATTLMRRILGDDHRRQIEVSTFNGRSLPKDPDARRRELGTGIARKANRALNETARRNCDGLVFVHDSDREADERRASLEAALAVATVPVVLGIPIETIEAWLLSDPAAVAAVLGSTDLAIPRDPETLWGAKHGPGHPKFEWNRVCRTAGYDHGQVTQTAVAARASLNTLRAACPLGFAPFEDRLLRAFPAFDIVVAVDQGWGIGSDNGLPWPKLKTDLAHFRTITSSCAEGKRNAILMGRKTWESKEVNQRALPRRQTVVISRRDQNLPEGVLGARSLTEALFRAGTRDDVDQIFVVGGAQIYREALAHPRFRHAYVTRIDHDFQTDTKIPNLDATLMTDPTWSGTTSAEDAGFSYRIERLTRRPET